jgi:hypothetical protein
VQFGKVIRVVRSLETKTVRRQITGQEEWRESDWVCATMPKARVDTELFVETGHKRWDIEYKPLNDIVN